MSNVSGGVLWWMMTETEYQEIVSYLEGTGFDLDVDFSFTSDLMPGYVFAPYDSVSEAEWRWLLNGDDDEFEGIELGTFTFSISNQPSHRI